MTRRFVLYAPNVHTGGGLVLLSTLLKNVPGTGLELTAFLDFRARDSLSVPEGCQVRWVMASVLSRMSAEVYLRRKASEMDAVIFCFHGLPPILPSRAKIIVFQQNRNYLGLNPLSAFSGRTRIRLAFERLIGYLLRHKVTTYIVQTPTMRRELIAWYQRGTRSNFLPSVRVLSFVDDFTHLTTYSALGTSYDFVYVSDGEAHKNHRNLIKAWAILADEGLRPTLALTLTIRDKKLREEVELAAHLRQLAIVDLGHLPRIEIMALYRRAKALIFPSKSESMGLPLVEASRVGLPILAGELDYVRDVCEPRETFNPDSPVSIARAVKRFLGNAERPSLPSSASGFWQALMYEIGAESS